MKYSTSDAAKAQADYCRRKKLPNFAPVSGRCYRCGRSIYEQGRHPGGFTTKGISTERAGSELITGCPHCNYSFVD